MKDHLQSLLNLYESPPPVIIIDVVAVVVEWLACLPVTQRSGFVSTWREKAASQAAELT